MLRLFSSLMIISMTVLVSSCFKEDTLVTPHVAGKYITDTITLTGTYKNQVYYSLSDSNAVGVNDKNLWDLGFESSASGWRVILNSSCFMKTTVLDGQIFGIPSDTTGSKWLFNPSDGSADSLAIGHWFSINGNDTLGTNQLLLIDRGLDENGIARGFCQFIMDSLKGGTYYFRIAAMKGTNPHSYSVSKKSGVNHVLFSISNPASGISEPQNSTWDLMFSQYTTLLFTDAGQPYPYLVTGVILNPVFVEAAVDSITPFADIDLVKAQAMTFTRQADRIGYLWKKYDFNSGSYTVNSDIAYIIRDTKGFLYKLRFIGFYKYHDNTLEKGFPSFEYQRL